MYDDEDAHYVYGLQAPPHRDRDAIAPQRYRELAARARSYGVWWQWWHGEGWSGAGRIVRPATNKNLALDQAERMLEELI